MMMRHQDHLRLPRILNTKRFDQRVCERRQCMLQTRKIPLQRGVSFSLRRHGDSYEHPVRHTACS